MLLLLRLLLLLLLLVLPLVRYGQQVVGLDVELVVLEAEEQLLDESAGGDAEEVLREEVAHFRVQAKVVEGLGAALAQPENN